MKTAQILRSGNMIVINPTTDRIYDLLSSHLVCAEKVILRGRDKWLAQQQHRPTVFAQNWDCFSEDHKGRLATSFGFFEKIRKLLAQAGYAVELVDLDPHPKPEIFNPLWARVEPGSGVELRARQREFLEAVVGHDNGRFDCPAGWGKSYMIGLVGKILPKVRIDVVSKRVAVVRDRIYPELCQMLPSVGIVGGGRKIEGKRIMCYTVDSLHHSDFNADMVFVDEVHEAAANKASGLLAKYDYARMYGLSASHDMRLDNKDIRCEAMCGPIRFTVSYQEAQAAGMVVPIVVFWSDVISDIDPCAGLEQDHEKKRAGLWRNDPRNKTIKRDARLYGDDVQVLIVTECVEHALALKELLPEFTLMYNGTSLLADEGKRLNKLRREGLIPDNFRLLDDSARERITRRFEKGKLKKVIATTVWNVGVSMNHLQVLIRADGGGSPINDTQIPPRTSRINNAIMIAGKKRIKEIGIIHDYKDQFNSGFHRRAKNRLKNYRSHGWTNQSFSAASRSTLRKLMDWGDQDA